MVSLHSDAGLGRSRSRDISTKVIHPLTALSLPVPIRNTLLPASKLYIYTLTTDSTGEMRVSSIIAALGPTLVLAHTSPVQTRNLESHNQDDRELQSSYPTSSGSPLSSEMHANSIVDKYDTSPNYRAEVLEKVPLSGVGTDSACLLNSVLIASRGLLCDGRHSLSQQAYRSSVCLRLRGGLRPCYWRVGWHQSSTTGSSYI